MMLINIIYLFIFANTHRLDVKGWAIVSRCWKVYDIDMKCPAWCRLKLYFIRTMLTFHVLLGLDIRVPRPGTTGGGSTPGKIRCLWS